MTMLQPDMAVAYVKGVGPKRAAALDQLEIHTFRDLLYHFPRRYLDRSTITSISQLQVGSAATIVGKVVSQNAVRSFRRAFFQVDIQDASGRLACVWFNGINYIKNVFHLGETVAMSGKVEYFKGLRFIHPDYDRLESGEWDLTLHTARIIALYPSSAELKQVGLDSRGFRRLLRPVFEKCTWSLPEVLPPAILSELRLAGIDSAVRQIHFPDSANALEQAQTRFKFEELFFLQLMLGVRRAGVKTVLKPHQYRGTGALLKTIYTKLPFQLTAAQKRAVHEIWDDLKAPTVMNRLLHGDVGSGKTVVALLSASIAISNGLQVALMAPTEILAEQHFRVLQQLGEPAGIRVRLLIGGQNKRERQAVLTEIAEGQAELIVGTHALIEENVQFRNLALVIIDEQHRFGVLQRSQLIAKGWQPDVLIMTATPIPRTLSMTIYGDMDISVLDELPARKGRLHTRIINEDQLGKAYAFIAQQVTKGHQAYIVYPLIDESAKLDLQAAIQGFEYLQTSVFPQFRLALLHGGMKTTEKEAVMQAFNQGTVHILVSTTVVEVGVDNPNAVIMLIENAERFGLTQLHQLRGRVGRGTQDGLCILVERKRSDLARQRLEVISSTVNGFEISESDLKLRGPGEFYGTRQHGFPRLKLADLTTDLELLKLARRSAHDLLKNDPHLRKPEHQPTRQFLLDNYRKYMEFANVL